MELNSVYTISGTFHSINSTLRQMFASFLSYLPRPPTCQLKITQYMYVLRASLYAQKALQSTEILLKRCLTNSNEITSRRTEPCTQRALSIDIIKHNQSLRCHIKLNMANVHPITFPEIHVSSYFTNTSSGWYKQLN
jgi:hypothetical protein